MSPRPRILDILAECPDPAADQALVAGATHVEHTYQVEIISTVLARGDEIALKAIPSLFDMLEPETQDLIIPYTSRLSATLRLSIRSSRAQTRLNTLQVIGRAGCHRLAYLAALAIHDGSPKVRAEAAITLLDLTQKHLRNHDDTTTALLCAAEPDGSTSLASVKTLKLLQDERKFLISAIVDALNCYESHHRPEVVEAAMYLATELEESLFQQSTLKRGKLTHAMLEILTGSVSPRLAPFTYLALCYRELRRQVVNVISKHRDTEFFAEFIRCHWLSRDTTVRKNLVSIRELAWLGDGLEPAFTLPPDVAALTPGWLLALGLPSDRKVALILNFLLLDDLTANSAAVAALLRIDTPASTLALQSVLDHDDEGLVRIARREIDHREAKQQKLVRRPRKDRPEAWSDLLDRAGLPEEFDALWQNFDRLHPVQAKVAGHHALKYIPGLATQLQVKILSTNAVDRLRALRLIILLHVAPSFENDVFSLANDTTPEVRALTMTALGHIGGTTSRRILERALADENPTVQAGAIDALDASGVKDRAELIAPKTNSQEPSVRAAAIRAMLRMRLPQAAADLIAMLNDPRVEHRCAALWIIDQLKIDTVIPRLLEIEKHDHDPRIARIAQHVCKRLERLKKPASPAKRVLVEGRAK